MKAPPGWNDAGMQLPWRKSPSVDAIDRDCDTIPLVDVGKVDPVRIRRGEIPAEFLGTITPEHIAARLANARNKESA